MIIPLNVVMNLQKMKKRKKNGFDESVTLLDLRMKDIYSNI